MIITTTEPCGCRGCGRVIGKNVRISWIDGSGPFHIECTPEVQDALDEHNRIEALTSVRAAPPSETPLSIKRGISSEEKLLYCAVLIATAFLLAGIVSKFNEQFYLLLRISVFLAFLFLAFRKYKQKIDELFILLIIPLFWYNPIFLQYHSHSTWQVLDMITLALMLYATRTVYRHGKKT